MNFFNRWGRKFSFLTEIDLRTLALFRISFGALCIVDIFRRAPRFTLLYSNDGVWANHMAMYIQEGSPPFSLLYAFSTLGEVTTFFLLYGVCLFLFTIGYRTKLFHILSLIGMVSVYNRNQLVTYGGDAFIIILFYLTLLLPLGAVASVDAIRAGKLKTYPINDNGFPCVRSLICTGIYIQFALLYFYSASEKSGITWFSGSAIHYFLHLDKSATPIGVALRGHIHPAVSLILSWGALLIEWVAPFLILSPFATAACRRVAILCIIPLQVGIALMQSIAVFQPLMIISLILLIPSSDLRLIPMSKEKSDEKQNTSPSFLPFALRELIGVFLICFMIALSIRQNLGFRKAYDVQIPSWIPISAYYGGFREAWGFFSPDVGIGDARLVIDIRLKDGQHIDPQTGKDPYYGPLYPGLMKWDELWHNYTEGMAWRRRPQFLVELERWIQSRRRGLNIDPELPIESYKVTLIKDLSPPPGSSDDVKPMIRKTEVLIDSTSRK